MTKETGTLDELKVKPRDVVECVENEYPDHIGLELIIRDDGMAVIQSEKYNGGIFDPRLDANWRRKYRIVSRASCAEDQPPATPKTWGEMTDEERDAVPQSVLNDPPNRWQTSTHMRASVWERRNCTRSARKPFHAP